MKHYRIKFHEHYNKSTQIPYKNHNEKFDDFQSFVICNYTSFCFYLHSTFFPTSFIFHNKIKSTTNMWVLQLNFPAYTQIQYNFVARLLRNESYEMCVKNFFFFFILLYLQNSWYINFKVFRIGAFTTQQQQLQKFSLKSFKSTNFFLVLFHS